MASGKEKNDPYYRDNQSRPHREWLKNQPEYWSQYREANPIYVERNREQQHRRNRQRQASSIAKMDSWLVELAVVARDSADLADHPKILSWLDENPLMLRQAQHERIF